VNTQLSSHFLFRKLHALHAIFTGFSSCLLCTLPFNLLAYRILIWNGIDSLHGCVYPEQYYIKSGPNGNNRIFSLIFFGSLLPASLQRPGNLFFVFPISKLVKYLLDGLFGWRVNLVLVPFIISKQYSPCKILINVVYIT